MNVPVSINGNEMLVELKLQLSLKLIIETAKKLIQFYA